MIQPPAEIPHPTAAELARECHRLINAIERHPYNVRLLLGVRSALLLYAGYKSGRIWERGASHTSEAQNEIEARSK